MCMDLAALPLVSPHGHDVSWDLGAQEELSGAHGGRDVPGDVVAVVVEGGGPE